MKLKKLSNAEYGNINIVCFPFAGGATNFYRNWVPYFNGLADLYALLLPGREELLSEKPIVTISEIVHEVIPLLNDVVNETKPYYFFGHSMGAIIAYELLKLIDKKEIKSPEKLFLSGFRAAHLPDRNPNIHDLPDDEFLSGAKRYQGISPEAEKYPELLKLMMPTLRADFAAIENYKYIYNDAVDTPIIAFGGSDDITVDKQELEEWGTHTTSTFKLYMFKGGHFYLSDKAKSICHKMISEM